MYNQITVVHSGRSSENQNGNRIVDWKIVTVGFQRGTKSQLGTGIKTIHVLAKIWLLGPIFESLNQSQFRSSASQRKF